MIQGEYILIPPWPDVKAAVVHNCLESDHRNKIVRHIRDQNLDIDLNVNQGFYKSLCSFNSIQSKLHLPVDKLQFNLTWAVYCGHITLVNLSSETIADDLRNMHHTYLAVDKSTLAVLEPKIYNLLETEFLKKFPAPLVKKNIPAIAREKLKQFPNADLNAYVCLYESILLMQSQLSKQPAGADEKAVVEHRILKQIKNHYLMEELPIGQAGDTQSRRAVDSQEWNDYRQKESGTNAIIEWTQAFTHLGPYFTSRIMLRKELFRELFDCIDQYKNWSDKDFNLVMEILKTTHDSLTKRNESELKIHSVQKIINILTQNG